MAGAPGPPFHPLASPGGPSDRNRGPPSSPSRTAIRGAQQKLSPAAAAAAAAAELLSPPSAGCSK